VTVEFPQFIQQLPRPDSPFAIDARIVPSDHVLTMFYSMHDDLEIPEHRHGPQWGVVLAGTLEMEIEGVVTRYGVGDTYYVGDDVPHIARVTAGYQGIDVFADAHRYDALT